MGGAYANYFHFCMHDVIRSHHYMVRLAATVKYYANDAASLRKWS